MLQRLHYTGALVCRHAVWSGHFLINKYRLPGIDAPRHRRRDILSADIHHIIIHRIRIACHGAPAGHCRIPFRPLRAVRTPLQVGKRRLIRIHIACARTTLDGHIAHRHALLHGETVKHLARILVGIARTTVHTQQTDNVQNHVLGIHTGLQMPIHIDAAHLQLAHRHRLRGQNIAHLARPYAKSDRAKRPVRARMGVAARNRRSGLGYPLLWPHDMHDPLLAAPRIEKRDPIQLAVLANLLHHRISQAIRVRLLRLIRRHNMVHRRKRAARVAHRQPKVAQHPKCLRARHLVNEVRPNQQLRLPIGQLAHRMCVPYFLIERFTHDFLMLNWLAFTSL